MAASGPFDPRMGMRMLERIGHRGPRTASRAVGAAWLGHRGDGGEPLTAGETGLWLVGDGRVAVRGARAPEAGAPGTGLRAGQQAALDLAARLRDRAWPRLAGRFALAIAGEGGRFVAVRDALGAAPLYLARRGDAVVFASELKAFDEDWRRHAMPLPPGHTWTPQRGLSPWVPALPQAPVLLPRTRPADEPPPWVLAAIRETLTAAVERTLADDPAAGVLLSGGLDSTLVTALAARVVAREGRTLPTFSGGLPGSADLRAARRAAELLGTEHHECTFTPEEAIAALPGVVATLESFDPSLVRSAVPNHLVAASAREHVGTVLVGEGADELFAGYAHHAVVSSSGELQAELLKGLLGMHWLGLQRVDRMTTANGLEARAPFLDEELVDLALLLPAAWKLPMPERMSKWLLRRAFVGDVPDELLWRPKEQFGDGAGIGALLAEHLAATVGDADLERERGVVHPPLRNRAELALYRRVAADLPGIAADRNVGRFFEDDGRVRGQR